MLARRYLQYSQGSGGRSKPATGQTAQDLKHSHPFVWHNSTVPIVFPNTSGRCLCCIACSSVRNSALLFPLFRHAQLKCCDVSQREGVADNDVTAQEIAGHPTVQTPRSNLALEGTPIAGKGSTHERTNPASNDTNGGQSLRYPSKGLWNCQQRGHANLACSLVQARCHCTVSPLLLTPT